MNNETEKLRVSFLNFLENTEDESRFNALYDEMERFLGIPTLASVQQRFIEGEISESESLELLKKSNQIVMSALCDLMRIVLPYDSIEQEFAIAAYYQNIKDKMKITPTV